MTDYPDPPGPEMGHADELALDVSSTLPGDDALHYADAEALASFNLKRIRAALNVSQQEIADRLAKSGTARLSQSQIAKIERGERPWKVNEMMAISDALNVHFNDFFQGMGTDDDIELKLADARIRLRAADFQEEIARQEFIDVKRRVREAEDEYLELSAKKGQEDALALRILHFRYYVNEARALEMESYREMVDPDQPNKRSNEAELWARAEFDRLRRAVAEKPSESRSRDELFPDPGEWFAEIIRKKARGEKISRDNLPDYL